MKKEYIIINNHVLYVIMVGGKYNVILQYYHGNEPCSCIEKYNMTSLYETAKTIAQFISCANAK